MICVDPESVKVEAAYACRVLLSSVQSNVRTVIANLVPGD